MCQVYLTWKAWSDRGFGQYSDEQALYYDLELRRSGLHNLCGLRIGEFGYGIGDFAGWVNDRGGDWLGLEIIPELLKRAASAGYAIVCPPATFSGAAGPEKLDAIVAFDVLEHLEVQEIRDFLTDARIALKPAGLLLARLPCGDSPFVGAIYYGDLTHRTLLGSSAVAQLALETGFELCQCRPPSFPLYGFGPVKTFRRIVVHGINTLVYWGVRNLIMGKSEAVISPNMWVVLKRSGSGADDVIT